MSVEWYTNQKVVGPMLILVRPICASPLLVKVALWGLLLGSGGDKRATGEGVELPAAKVLRRLALLLLCAG